MTIDFNANIAENPLQQIIYYNNTLDYTKKEQGCTRVSNAIKNFNHNPNVIVILCYVEKKKNKHVTVSVTK